MSRFLEDECVVYHKFQKIFNSFDIFMKRHLVAYFVHELGEGNVVLKYFNDSSLSILYILQLKSFVLKSCTKVLFIIY